MTARPEGPADAASRVLSLHLAPQGISVPTLPDQTLLDAAQAAGVRLSRACRNGTCRVCRCRLLAGRVRYRLEWPGLSAEEHAEGWVLPCVAVAETDVALGDVVCMPPR